MAYPEKKERNDLIIKSFAEGKTTTQISVIFGISRKTIWDILKGDNKKGRKKKNK